MKLERAEARETGGQVTIWLPVHWPVMTLSVIRRDTQDVMWQIAEESFRLVAMPREESELRIDRIFLEKVQEDDQSPASMVECSTLRYGEAPERMRQFVPTDGQPPALESGGEYLIAVRERPDTHLRRFLISLE